MNSAMKQLLKNELQTSRLESYGRAGGGCINQGIGYMTDKGPIFVKFNKDSAAKRMFDGEYESLAKLYATNCIRVPKPLKVIEMPSGGAMFAAEYIEMSSDCSCASVLGTQLARLHLHNGQLLKEEEKRESWVGSRHHEFAIEPVKQFGFHVTTCCGLKPMDNTWNADWETFYLRQRLQPQYEKLMESTGDRELQHSWPELMRKAPLCFEDCKEITPSLLHGDLWGGNVAQCSDGPVIFDPASFYGHSEFEFGIMTMFGGFGKQVYDAYHKLIPKAPGFERRLVLYQLFHYMNHWNHFGSSYRSQTMSLVKRVIDFKW